MPEEIPVQNLWETIDAKAKELSVKYGGKVIIPFALAGDNETDHIIGYIYELDGISDAKLFGAKIAGPEVSIPKAIQALESLIIWEFSDPRLHTKKCMNGAALFLLSLVESSMPELKKK